MQPHDVKTFQESCKATARQFDDMQSRMKIELAKVEAAQKIFSELHQLLSVTAEGIELAKGTVLKAGAIEEEK